ncbi:neuronal acetylcholine receptor subunit alpha-10-like [Branchiostoma floridae x Branchiostoma japonicum]
MDPWIFTVLAVLLVTTVHCLNETEEIFLEEDASGSGSGVEPRSPDIGSELRHFLVGNYDSSVRSVRNARQATEVKVDVALRQVLRLSERDQILTTVLWVRLLWTDEFLRWYPEEHGGQSVIRIPCKDIWLPDIYLYNNADEISTGKLGHLTDVIVQSNGLVEWPQPLTAKTSCDINTRFFPFDHQQCELLLGSWSYDGTQINFTHLVPYGDTSDIIENGEWELLSMSVYRELNYYSCCSNPYPNVRYVMRLRRKADYYIFTYVLPCLSCLVIVLGGFFLPTNAAVRIQLEVTSLLALTVYLLMIQENMPPSSGDVSILGEFYTGSIIIVGMATLATVCVIRIHESDEEVPNWLKRLLESPLLTSVVVQGQKEQATPTKVPPTCENTHKSASEDSVMNAHTNGHVISGEGLALRCENGSAKGDCQNGDCQTPDDPDRDIPDTCSTATPEPDDNAANKARQTDDKLANVLSLLEAHLEAKKTNRVRKKLWHKTAIWMNRILWLCLLVSSISSSIAIFYPAVKQYNR